MPKVTVDYSNDPRFYDCWSKLVPFSLTEYDRIVQLDSDMLCLKNMDELMEMDLDAPELGGKGDRVFAAGHACVCNPLKKPHYPKNWVPDNCAFTAQHADPESAQVSGGSTHLSPLSFMNGGLQVVNPSSTVYDLITSHLSSDAAMDMEFADQSLLSDLFRHRWVPLPYIYNALKTMRFKGVHDKIWRDENVKNIHYLLSPKPWDEMDAEGRFTGDNESHGWWVEMCKERWEDEKKRGIAKDGF